MHFTIATRERLLRADYVPTTRHIEFSDGRTPLKVGRTAKVCPWKRVQHRYG